MDKKIEIGRRPSKRHTTRDYLRATGGDEHAREDLRRYLFMQKSRNTVVSFFFFTLVIGMSFTILYSLIATVPNVFSNMRDLGDPDIGWIPKRFATTSFDAAYRMMMTSGPLTMLWSVLYAFTIMLIQILISAMVGYALARSKFPGKNMIWFFVILTFLVPRQSLLISQYLHFKNFDPLNLLSLLGIGKIDLIDKPATLYAMNILGFGVNQSLFIFIFRQFFIGLPKEIEEASMIDGCGYYRTFFKVILPNAKPSMLTVGVLAFVWNYTDTYLTGYFDASGPYLSVILNQRFGPQNQNFVIDALQRWYQIPNNSVLMFDATKQAAALIYIIPLIVVYFLSQRKLVENLETAGIVG